MWKWDYYVAHRHSRLRMLEPLCLTKFELVDYQNCYHCPLPGFLFRGMTLDRLVPVLAYNGTAEASMVFPCIVLQLFMVIYLQSSLGFFLTRILIHFLNSIKIHFFLINLSWLLLSQVGLLCLCDLSRCMKLDIFGSLIILSDMASPQSFRFLAHGKNFIWLYKRESEWKR